MNDDEKLRSIYPDILESGGLLTVIRSLSNGNPVGAEFNGFGAGQNYAHVRFGDKAAQVFLCLDERLFLFDFWEGQQRRASGSSPKLDDARDSIAKWLLKDTSLEILMKHFPFIMVKK